MQKKWPFINKPAVQNVEQPKPEAPKVQQQPAPEQKPAQMPAQMPNPNATAPMTQQKPMQMPAQMPNPNATAPMTQQKPMQMPAQMPNPNATAPMTQQKPMQMPLPTVPAPKDNSMGPVKSLKMHHKMMNQDIMGQQVMEQPMKNDPFMQQHMDDHYKMDQHMKDQHMLGQQMKNEDLMDLYMKGEYMKGQEILGQKMKGEDMMEPMMGQQGKNYMMEQDEHPSTVEALRLIKSAVEGETEDRMFYDYLIRNARSEKDREIIMGIRDDEIKHAKLFRQLYYEHTGQHIRPDQNVSFDRPRTYCDGLIKALMGEQNAVRKYRKILFAMKDRRDINTLTEIITDELRHAALYNLLINNNECRY